jgi:FkbM family methyltransferase
MSTSTAPRSGRLRRWSRRLHEEGLAKIIGRRWRWYKNRFCMDNRRIGRYVELRGNRVRLPGVSIPVDNPLITTPQKSTLYFGLYELNEIELIRHHLDPALPVIELGASIGVVSNVINRRLQQPQNHVVVEANPLLIPTLQRNRELNDARFQIVPAAVAYDTDAIDFYTSDCFVTGNISQQQGQLFRVPAIGLSALADQHGFATFTLISDIEGAEAQMVAHEQDLLRERVQNIIIETHPDLIGEQATVEMIATLRQLGFSETARAGQVLVLSNRQLSSVGHEPCASS